MGCAAQPTQPSAAMRTVTRQEKRAGAAGVIRHRPLAAAADEARQRYVPRGYAKPRGNGCYTAAAPGFRNQLAVSMNFASIAQTTRYCIPSVSQAGRASTRGAL